jgi:hypothetical protein
MLTALPTTVLCLAAALGSPLLVGLPLLRLLRRGRPQSERAWLETPFVGLAAIIVVLQNLVYLEIPLRQSVPWFWLAVGALWLAVRPWRDLKQSWRYCPAGVFAASAGVYLVQGVGVLLLGAPHYLGNHMADQFDYIVTAEYLADCPFSTSRQEIGPRPHLLRALLYKDDRIGQAVLQGFLAVSTGQPAETVYEVTSLLGPGLVVVPFYWLARGLGLRRRTALLLGVTAGLLPAVTQLRLEGFLSQTLVLPLLFALAVTAQRALVTASAERVLIAMLLMVAAASIYPEFLPILVALVLVLAVVGGLTGHGWKKGVAVALAVLLAPLVLQPLALPHYRMPFARLSAVLFPEYYRTRVPALPELVWLGEEFRPLGWTFGLRGLALVLMVLGMAGLIGLGLRQWWRSWRRPAFLLAWGVFALALAPVLPLLSWQSNPYPLYKLTLTCGPLLALGLGLWLPRLRLALLLLAATGTVLMEYESARHDHTPYAHLRSLESDDFRWADRQLQELGAGELFLAVERNFHAAWLCYHSRHHHIWLLPSDDDFPIALPPETAAPVYFLVEETIWPVRGTSGQGKLLARQGRFSLWQWHGIPTLLTH